jgi:ketosteroid isomerase-like protein
MSQENIALLRRSNDAFRRGDWDAWSANFDPDILIRTDPEWPEQRIYGRDAVVDWGRSVGGVLGTSARIEEIRDLGDRVLARVRWEGSGQESGITGEIAWTELVTVRNGRIIFIEMFFDHGQALRSVGLEDRPPTPT